MEGQDIKLKFEPLTASTWKQFETLMIDLINLMEETKIADRGMKSIRKLFIQNLEAFDGEEDRLPEKKL